ncbi:MAG: GNAT family N-acetyltransferase, partial [Pseudomonadota bacterium]
MSTASLSIEDATSDPATADALATLWQRCGLTRPWNDPHKDIAFALSQQNATILLGRTDGHLAASAMVGHDGHRGTVY